MTTKIIPAPKTQLSPHLEEVAEEARQIIAAGVPENTRRTYRSQWTTFCGWCQQHDRCPLPASGETVVLFLTDRSRAVKVSSLEVGLAAITVAHREAGHQDWSATDLPGVRIFMRGLRRKKGSVTRKKNALTYNLLKQALTLGGMDAGSLTTTDKRDRAILLLGFFSALRRAEISALDVDDISEIPTGLRIAVWGSKTDKKMEGQVVSVPHLPDDPDTCPVIALKAWLKVRGVDSSKAKDRALFTSIRTGSRLQPQGIARVVKKAAKSIGLDPKDFGAHSLRSGFVTSAAQSDVKERDIMGVTRHTSERTLRGYIHEATLGANHPGKKIVEGE